jgi:hypothetical protein
MAKGNFRRLKIHRKFKKRNVQPRTPHNKNMTVNYITRSLVTTTIKTVIINVNSFKGKYEKTIVVLRQRYHFSALSLREECNFI